MAKQKIRIRLKSYDHEVIDNAAKKLVDEMTRTDVTVVGLMPLSTKKNILCVIHLPHRYKDGRGHFKIRTHRRLIDIADPTLKTIDTLHRLDLPADVNMEIKF